jgi:NAD(P)-dependent dehydrogenase (short-subunit alcohol dehydrogenase family)
MGRTIVVLGGSSGIGKAIAWRFATEGDQVIVASPDMPACRDLIARLPGNGHLAVEVDVLETGQLEGLEEAIRKKYGQFEVLINCIGLSRAVPALSPDFPVWDLPLQVMLYGAVRACRLLIPLLSDQGRIIHITSIHHERVAKGSSAYGMAKAALTQFTRSLAVELAFRGILANTIAPGFINTAMSVKEDGINELESQWFADNYIRYDHLPLKRAGQPEEVAGVAWFLAGPDASYMTGSVLTVDGGLTITF